jgi:carbon monoxide dehydrogenase subunit G
VRIESSFEVAADRATAWALLMDVPRVVPCMPGAELVAEVDESNWKANMNVKMGPIALTFATDVCREEADETAGRVLLSAKAREIRGRGAAQATIESTLAAADGGTSIGVVTDLALSGAVARYGRGIVLDVTEQLVAQFADGLRTELEAREDGRPETARPAKPVSGFGLVLHAVWASLARPFRGG